MYASSSMGTGARATKKRKYALSDKAPFTKSQTSAIAKIAKKVDLRLAETKSFISTSTRSATSDIWYASNLIYPITENTGNENVIGEKMYITNMKFRVSFVSATARTSTPQFLRVAVVKAKKDFTNSHSAITNTDLIRSPAAAQTADDFIDQHKVIKLKDLCRSFNPQTASGASTFWEFTVPVNRTEYFLIDNGGYFMQGNYYLCLQATDFSGINTCGTFSFTWTVNFKDM